MFELTRQERAVLIVLSCVLLFGSVLNYAFKKNPQLRDIVNFVESDRAYRKVDLNSASSEELTKIPYIGPALAERIIDYRRTEGSFKEVSEVRYLKGVGPSRFKKIKKYLTLSTKKP